ncbi:L-rhamnose mutarotase [Tessaracoccus sp. MC1865]|uniref:L-rhamnose mutarotase n=1 Tax=Tessaracoccus sp. MC1865 TaxID=2760310 RepID=UPI001603E93F|nr:L-rhamnose mutarotase [Tessaracoccus sp. MC1865]MBB1482921.1 L-rhamnose mutarotase [Tessaracoccus sp. MC1865]QTO37640.1 L-rhamnose mutarotase [Tessaracoccus sp. MC1865]
MERLLFIMRIKPGMEREYERRHDAVWPALLRDLHDAGFRNYSLFRRDLEVYAYAECHPDAEDALAAIGRSATNAEWGAWFTDVLEALPDDAGLTRADEVWHMDESLAAASDSNDPSRPGR